MTAAVWTYGGGTFLTPLSSSVTGLTSQAYKRLLSSAVRQDPNTLAIQSAKGALDRLSYLEADWDGFGSCKPQAAAIARAIALLPELVSAGEQAGGWSLPHVSANETGEVILEWWVDAKKLTLFIGRDEVDYLLTWGEHIEADMEDGPFTAGTFSDAWARLTFK